MKKISRTEYTINTIKYTVLYMKVGYRYKDAKADAKYFLYMTGKDIDRYIEYYKSLEQLSDYDMMILGRLNIGGIIKNLCN